MTKIQNSFEFWIWCLMLDAWCLMLDAWCLVLGAWCLVLVIACRFTLAATRYATALRNSVFSTVLLFSDNWFLFGIWYFIICKCCIKFLNPTYLIKMFIFFSKYDIKILSAHFLYISVKQLFILRNPDCGLYFYILLTLTFLFSVEFIVDSVRAI